MLCKSERRLSTAHILGDGRFGRDLYEIDHVEMWSKSGGKHTPGTPSSSRCSFCHAVVTRQQIYLTRLRGDRAEREVRREQACSSFFRERLRVGGARAASTVRKKGGRGRGGCISFLSLPPPQHTPLRARVAVFAQTPLRARVFVFAHTPQLCTRITAFAPTHTPCARARRCLCPHTRFARARIAVFAHTPCARVPFVFAHRQCAFASFFAFALTRPLRARAQAIDPPPPLKEG